MKLIDKSALVAEIESLKEENKPNSKSISEYIKGGIYGFDLAIEKTLGIIDTLEMKEVNEVPATVMVNKYGNRFISSWPGLKEYDDLKKGQEIKIVILKK